MVTLIRIICLLALSIGGLTKAVAKNVFTYNIGNSQTIQLSIQFSSATKKTQIEVQVEKAGSQGQIFYQEIPQLVESIEIPEPTQVKAFDNQDKITFDRNEFNAYLLEQRLLSIKVDEGRQARLFVLPVEENLKELVQNKRPTVFDFYDGLENKSHLFRTYSFRLLTSENLIEKGLSINPQLLFTYADHSLKDKDFVYSDLKLVAVDAQTSKNKAINISDTYIPVNEVAKYPVTISYSSSMKDYSYHIRLPDGGKIIKTISERTQWMNSNALALHINVNKGASWGLENMGTPTRPMKVGFNFNPSEEPGFGARSPEIEEGLSSQNKKTFEDKQSLTIKASRPNGIIEIAKYLQTFKTQVEEIVKGQPEGVEVLQKMEQKHQAEGLENSKPQVAWFLGMPGTGKDTLVEAYIEAKHKLIYPGKDIVVEDHIYRLPKLKEEKDLWSLTGSGTGYKGSDSLSPLIRWLVKHSGGRYIIKVNDKTQEVHENPDWKPGQVLDGYYSPDEAVLFANELHDWSKMMINTFLKEALEKGFFEIGNGGKGVNRIQVPINIIIASNHGIGKIAARDSEGKRVGKPLDFNTLEERWNISHKNKTALLEELKSPTPGNAEGGCSEEVLTRIPKSNISLLRPLSKEGVKYIAKFKLKKLTKKYAKQKINGFPQMNYQFDDSVLEFLATYDQIAEDGARIVDDKINDLIEKPLLDAIISGKINKQNTLKVSIRQNKDTTFSLLVTASPEQPVLNLIIKGTLKEKAIQSISDQRINELNNLEERLNRKVKGASHIIKELARDVRRSENSEKTNNPELNDRQADVYMFLGTSSTGKTELAVAIHQELYRDNSKPLVIDFGQVQTINDLKEKVLGKRDAKNAAVASDFMQEFDRRNGDLVVVFDEVANANPEVLKGLYDILREPVVNNFSDSKPRSMGRVKIIMTGNAGEEWYQGIPRDIPDIEQYEAARKIYESSVENDQFKRNFLMKKFSEALLNRVSLNRVYFFGPHTHKTIRELIQLKLLKATDKFNEVKKGVRTWKVGFSSFNDYKGTIEAIEKYGFKIWEQGASITQFIDKQLMNQLHDELLTRKVPEGSVVKLKKVSDLESKKAEEGTLVKFELQVENQKESISLSVRGKKMEKPVKQNPKDFILTAIHEAGHAFLSRALLGDKVRSQGVSIIPGVTEIDGHWIRYEGVAISEELERMSMTREALISRIAVLLGGGVAESLATKNYKVTAGHQNDLQRVSKLATQMVVDFGLADYQGPSRQEGQSIDAYLNSLSAMQRRKIDKAVDQIRKEAQALAENMLMAHFDSFIVPIAKSLSAKGELRGEVLNRYFDMKSYQIYSIYDDVPMKKAIQQYKKQIKSSSEVTSPTARRDFEFHNFMQTNTFKVFNLEEALKTKFYNQVNTVDLSQGQRYVVSDASLKQTLLAKRAQVSRMCLKFYGK